MTAIQILYLRPRPDGVAPTPTEVAELMEVYAKLKCEELLRTLGEMAMIKGGLDAKDILIAVDTETFVK